jgi:hypothetical protein
MFCLRQINNLMRYVFLIGLLIACTVSLFGQDNGQGAFKTVLQLQNVGKEYTFDRSKPNDFDSLVLVYLGKIRTYKGEVLKVVTSRWYWGLARRATSRIIIFNDKNQYLGDYYLTLTFDVPDKISENSLVFINDSKGDCESGLTTIVSFKKGIPKKFFLKCKGDLGDIYTFEQNL